MNYIIQIVLLLVMFFAFFGWMFLVFGNMILRLKIHKKVVDFVKDDEND